jgi:HSP90 family molecular chaperone
VTALLDRFTRDQGDPLVETTADPLLGLALLAEGSELTDPVGFNTQLTALLERTLEAGEAHAD